MVDVFSDSVKGINHIENLLLFNTARIGSYLVNNLREIK